MIVADASALVDALVGSGHSRDRIASEPLTAPHVVDAEVGQALRRLVFTHRLAPRTAEAALDHYVGLEIWRYEHAVLMRRAWDLRTSVTFTDALYVALAEMLNIPLVTLDRRLAGAPGILATVEVIASG